MQYAYPNGRRRISGAPSGSPARRHPTGRPPAQKSAGRGRSRGPTLSRTTPRPWQAWRGQVHRGETARAPCAQPPAFGAPADRHVARGPPHSAGRRAPGGPPAVARRAPRRAVASGGSHWCGARRLAATHRRCGQPGWLQIRRQEGRRFARRVITAAWGRPARPSARGSAAEGMGAA